MDDPIEFVVHHGGKIIITKNGLEYVGGKVCEAAMERDVLSVYQLKDIGVKDLKYASVERIFYMTPGATMAAGLHPIRVDSDVMMLDKDSKKAVIELFLETTENESFVRDNEDSPTEWEHGYDSTDEDGDQSAIFHDFEYLMDDSDRTSDSEFYEALDNLGIPGRCRHVHTNYCEDGEEVDQVIELTEPPAADGVQDEMHEPNVDDERNADADDEREGDNVRDGQINEEDPEYFVDVDNLSPRSSYRGSSQSNHACCDKINGEEVTSLAAGEYYDPTCDHSKLVFKEGLKFQGPTQFKEAVVNYAILSRVNIRWTRSGKKKMEVVCCEGCPWRFYARWFGRNLFFTVKSVGLSHTCDCKMENRSVTTKWIAKRYFSRFRINPNLNTAHLAQEIRETYGIDVTVWVCSNAKGEARKMLEGTLLDGYAKLRSYVLQLKKSDPQGRFVLEVDPVPGQQHVLFRRIYIGFSCLKRGFLHGCRKMFGLDGCFLKGEVQGMLLSVVGKDGNNQMFPLAWAVVESENQSSWNWFIEILQEELLLADETGWSVISDQQKGLVDALQRILPLTEHRKCARHVSANWKIKHKSAAGKKAFWDAVYVCNVPEYKTHMDTLKHLQDSSEDPDAYTDFLKYDPTTFSRAYVSRVPKCDSIESNICETFNGCIVKWRGLRIINMLEGIRTYMMTRIVAKVKLLDSTSETMLCPRIAAKIEKIKLNARHCIVRQTLELLCM